MVKQVRAKLSLNEHFTYGKLLRYTMPSILMMIFMSIYTVIDGFFISNYIGKQAFAAVNFIWPFVMILTVFGFMFGSGGSALIGKLLGEKKDKKAKEVFTMVVLTSALTGIVLMIIGIIFLPQIAALMGGEGEMLDYAVRYGRILLYGLPFAMLQFEFQNLFNTAEKPLPGMLITIAAGCMNILLDGLFVALASWGVEGAGLATISSQIVGAIIPLIYFSCKNSSLLRFVRFKFDWKALGKVLANGSSELLANVAISLVSIFYNIQLLKLAGENGVAAYGILMYVLTVFNAVFVGYIVSSAPLTSYNYGARNTLEMKSLLKKSLVIISISSVLMFVLSEVLALPLAKIYASYDEELLRMTVKAFRISGPQYLFMGIAMYGSGYFTSLNNGLISAIIAFVRTLVFQTIFVFVLPIFWGLEGIWSSLTFAELTCTILVFIFLIAMEKRYGYGFWKKTPKIKQNE